MPGGINPSIYHGYFTQIKFGVEGRNGLNSVAVVVSPMIFWVPPAVISVHVSAPIDIRIGWVIENMVIVCVSIMVVMEFHLPGRICIVVMVTTVVALAGILVNPGIFIPIILYINVGICLSVSTARIVGCTYTDRLTRLISSPIMLFPRFLNLTSRLCAPLLTLYI